MTESKKLQQEATKRLLAKSVRKLMETKPLEKITIEEITSNAGFKRQTFYYHFTDVNSLLWWTVSEDISRYLSYEPDQITWEERILHILEYLEKNRAFCLSAIKSIGKEPLKELLTIEVNVFIRNTIENERRESKLSEEDIEFLILFVAGGIDNILNEWLAGNVIMEKEEVIRYAEVISDIISKEFTLPQRDDNDKRIIHIENE